LLDIRQASFDLVLDLQGLARSGLVAWLANAAASVGVEDWREGALGFYDRTVPRPSPLTHAVDWYLEVLRKLDVPVHWNFTWMPVRAAAAAAVRTKWHPEGCRWISVVPGARWPNKCWPVEHYAATVRLLSLSYPNVRFAILGGRAEAALGAAISKAAPGRCLDLMGRTNLAELIEWVRLSELVITNDTGPMHIAAALAKPLVAIFGPTEPRRTGPYGQIDRALRIPLPCAPCLRPTCSFEKPVECLRAISPSAVYDRACQFLETPLGERTRHRAIENLALPSIE
jgi:lipopolysaccharide heptosyltransferase II